MTIPSPFGSVAAGDNSLTIFAPGYAKGGDILIVLLERLDRAGTRANRRPPESDGSVP